MNRHFRTGKHPSDVRATAWSYFLPLAHSIFCSVTVGSWDIKMTAECLLPLVRTILAVKIPSYDTVLDMDHKIRDAFQPPSMQIDDEPGLAVSMLRFGRSLFQELSKSSFLVQKRRWS